MAAELLRLKDFVPTALSLLAKESVRIANDFLPTLEKAAAMEVQKATEERDAAYHAIAEAVAVLAVIVGEGQALNAVGNNRDIRGIADAKDLPKTGTLDIARVFRRDMLEVRTLANSKGAQAQQAQIQGIQWQLQKHLDK